MRILVYEYLSSGVLAGQPATDSLRREGLAMFQAVLGDLALCPGIETAALLDPALLSEGGWPGGLSATLVQSAEAEYEALSRLARQVDAALIIAPEFGGLLEQRCRWLADWGVPLLGCDAEAVRLTADKLTMSQLWRDAGVPTPECWHPGRCPGCLVLKPRDGAGSQATFLLHGPDELAPALAQARIEGWSGELLVQPYVAGLPASVSLLLGTRDRWALPACRQILSSDGRFRYLGGELPLPALLNDRARQLAIRASEVVPGLRGHVGIDMVLGQAPDGSADWVIEINPRLTTSYVGLRRLARFNLAHALLALLGWSVPYPEPAWHEGPVYFRVSG